MYLPFKPLDNVPLWGLFEVKNPKKLIFLNRGYNTGNYFDKIDGLNIVPLRLSCKKVKKMLDSIVAI